MNINEILSICVCVCVHCSDIIGLFSLYVSYILIVSQKDFWIILFAE